MKKLLFILIVITTKAYSGAGGLTIKCEMKNKNQTFEFIDEAGEGNIVSTKGKHYKKTIKKEYFSYINNGNLYSAAIISDHLIIHLLAQKTAEVKTSESHYIETLELQGTAVISDGGPLYLEDKVKCQFNQW